MFPCCNNWEILLEYYAIDSQEVQFTAQDYYLKSKKILENGETLWEKVSLDKKRIVCINPNNGFSIAALQDLECEICLPDYLLT